MTRQTRKILLRITGLILFFTLLNGLTFIVVFAKSEGQLGDGLVLTFVADYLWFLAFPTYKIVNYLATNTDLVNTYFVLIAIGLTAILYTTLIEMIIRLTHTTRSTRKNKKIKTAANKT